MARLTVLPGARGLSGKSGLGKPRDLSRRHPVGPGRAAPSRRPPPRPTRMIEQKAAVRAIRVRVETVRPEAIALPLRGLLRAVRWSTRRDPSAGAARVGSPPGSDRTRPTARGSPAGRPNTGCASVGATCSSCSRSTRTWMRGSSRRMTGLIRLRSNSRPSHFVQEHRPSSRSSRARSSPGHGFDRDPGV